MTLREMNAYKRLPSPAVAADGCDLVLADGRRVLDLYGGHCVNTLGGGDRALGEVLRSQWDRLSFQTNLLDHPPRIAFLEAFAKNLPPGDWEVFCTNSGAEANENALKIALAVTGRRRVVAFAGAFHGRTAGAAAVTDTKNPQFPSAPFDVVRSPWGDATAVDGTVAAVILEPIQSLAGVVEPPAGFLESLRKACDAHGATLIFDEVQTGNGRLGRPWASQHFGVVPDLFTTAKGAAGGLPIGLTLAKSQIAARVPAGLLGSTFGGGPLVLAAATEVSRRIAAPGFLENVRATSAALRKAALCLSEEGRGAARGPIERVRGSGLLLGLVLRPGNAGAAVRDALLARGVLVGTSDDPRVLRLSPPLTLPPSAAAQLAEAVSSLTSLEVPA
ncbi:MAG TPA: aspartate aminotransferase family protein [Planctomycetota bacterium]|nr:aspartate aminotransferase family protein [Planctomycetota bacterium]